MTAALLLVALVAACKKGQQCSEDVPCGFTETCVEGTCIARNCATSAECPMEQHCEDGDCAEGCAEDGDCYPGEMCDAEEARCIESACRSTSVDCGFKEFCDSVTGECYEAAGYYCMDCVDDDTCGGNGNLCLNFGGGMQFCGVTCEYESDCPSGFTCVGIEDGHGNVISHQCIAYCWLHTDDERRVSPPRAPAPLPVDRGPATCDAEGSI